MNVCMPVITGRGISGSGCLGSSCNFPSESSKPCCSAELFRHVRGVKILFTRARRVLYEVARCACCTRELRTTKNERKAVREAMIIATEASTYCQYTSQSTSTELPLLVRRPEARIIVTIIMTTDKHRDSARASFCVISTRILQMRLTGIAITILRSSAGPRKCGEYNNTY